jgi:hypothetical protein
MLETLFSTEGLVGLVMMKEEVNGKSNRGTVMIELSTLARVVPTYLYSTPVPIFVANTAVN